MLVNVWLTLVKTPTVSLLVPVIPVTGATVQVYNVVLGTISVPEFIGVVVKAVPLQIVAILLAISGVGFTVTVIVNVLLQVFGEVPDVAVTVYVAVSIVVPLLFKVWLIKVWPAVWTLPPLTLLEE